MNTITRQEEKDPTSMNSTADAHPSRYAGVNGIECIDAIHAALGDDGFASFCTGQCIRYMWRYRRKNGANDLHKASDYLRWATETQEKIETRDAEGQKEVDEARKSLDQSIDAFLTDDASSAVLTGQNLEQEVTFPKREDDVQPFLDAISKYAHRLVKKDNKDALQELVSALVSIEDRLDDVVTDAQRAWEAHSKSKKANGMSVSDSDVNVDFSDLGSLLTEIHDKTGQKVSQKKDETGPRRPQSQKSQKKQSTQNQKQTKKGKGNQSKQGNGLIFAQ